MESKFEPLYYEYTQPKQTAGLIKKWAAGLRLGLVPHVTKENFHTLQRPIVMAYYNVDFKRDPKAGFQINSTNQIAPSYRPIRDQVFI